MKSLKPRIDCQEVLFLLPFLPISERSSPNMIKKQAEDDEIEPGSPPAENEFVSDAFQDEHISDEDFKKEMQLLGVEDEAVKVEGIFISSLLSFSYSK